MYSNRPRRRKFHSKNRSFRMRNGGSQRNNNTGSFSNGQIRSVSVKGTYNVSKLIEKYTNLAKEASTSGDKILSESYLQHADHFSRIIADNNKNNGKNMSVSQTETIANKEETIVNKEETIANKENDINLDKDKKD